MQQFFPDPYWDEYQFTDYFQQRKQPVMGNRWDNWTCPFPGSLLDDYHKLSLQQKTRGYRWDLLFQLVQERARHKEELLPLPNTLVVHLRLGDVLDSRRVRENVTELLYQQKYCYANIQTHWNAYVKPLSYFADSLRNLTSPNNRSYSSVVIMGSAHKGQVIFDMVPRKSCSYTIALQSYFERYFANVSLRLGRSPDDDIVFASHAAGYLLSGGAYSRLIQRLYGMNQAYLRNDTEALDRLAQEKSN